jgi:hypothetical protein
VGKFLGEGNEIGLRWAGRVFGMTETKNDYIILLGKWQLKKKQRWEDNCKPEFEEIVL